MRSTVALSLLVWPSKLAGSFELVLPNKTVVPFEPVGSNETVRSIFILQFKPNETVGSS